VELTPTFTARAAPGGSLLRMNKIIGIVLIAAGALALAYGGFSYTREKHDVKLGPIEFSVKQKEQVNVPVWAGVGAIAAGVVLLLLGSRK
jgi:drug/metabolite transporter (DMT)-like permease